MLFTRGSRSCVRVQEKPRGGLGGLFGGAKAQAAEVTEEAEETAKGGGILGSLFGGGGTVYADEEDTVRLLMATLLKRATS